MTVTLPIDNAWVEPYLAAKKHWRDIARADENFKFARVDYVRKSPPCVRRLHRRFPMCCVVKLTAGAAWYAMRHFKPEHLMQYGEHAFVAGLGAATKPYLFGAVAVCPLGRFHYAFEPNGDLKHHALDYMVVPPQFLEVVGYRHGFDAEAVAFFDALASSIDEEPDTEGPLTMRSAEVESFLGKKVGWERTG